MTRCGGWRTASSRASPTPRSPPSWGASSRPSSASCSGSAATGRGRRTMGKAGEGEGEALTPELTQRIDDACNRFEAAWKAGRGPRIEEFLGDVPGAGRAELLRHLLE